mmetsp:Transcript_11434/g.19379  ORF Transcript_11434/g.19379 Transcript_11434/m.19379 type:complete len:123 (-) Transcript_11434:325-693(-)
MTASTTRARPLASARKRKIIVDSSHRSITLQKSWRWWQLNSNEILKYCATTTERYLPKRVVQFGSHDRPEDENNDRSVGIVSTLHYARGFSFLETGASTLSLSLTHTLGVYSPDTIWCSPLG